jgi:hypothetical protein
VQIDEQFPVTLQTSRADSILARLRTEVPALQRRRCPSSVGSPTTVRRRTAAPHLQGIPAGRMPPARQRPAWTPPDSCRGGTTMRWRRLEETGEHTGGAVDSSHEGGHSQAHPARARRGDRPIRRRPVLLGELWARAWPRLRAGFWACRREGRLRARASTRKRAQLGRVALRAPRNDPPVRAPRAARSVGQSGQAAVERASPRWDAVTVNPSGWKLPMNRKAVLDRYFGSIGTNVKGRQ